jgi:hypothetical protein
VIDWHDEPMIPEDTHADVAALAERVLAEFPRFRLVAKEGSRFMRTVAAVMPWNPAFLTDYTTTIGYTVYMPAPVRRDGPGGVRVLRHERVHLDQFRRHPVWFPLSYLFVAPALVTMRARWELEAYVETMRDELEVTGDVSDATLDEIERRFTGPDYLYMDVRRRRVRRKIERARASLRHG